MAQVNTGLGWEAKGEYLRESDGIMGTLRESEFVHSDGPIYPTRPTLATLTAQGYYIGTWDSRYNFPLYMGMLSTTFSNVYRIACCKFGATYRIIYVFDADPGTLGKYVYTGGTYVDETALTQKTYDSEYGLWYAWAMSDTTIVPDASITVYESSTFALAVKLALAALAGTAVNYYKLNSGYAVACFAKYNDVGGGIKVTPVLISTVEANTKLSIDGSTEAASVMLTKMIDGMLFYMRYMPSASGDVSGTPAVAEAILTNFAALVPAGVFNALVTEPWANVRVTESNPPYGQGNTDNAGGDSDPEDGVEDIPFSMPPYVTASDAGFVQLFNPTQGEMTALAAFMWSSGFDLDTLKRVYASPIDYIIGASIVPVIPSLKEASHAITLPGVLGPISTGVSMDVVYQYSTVNCGTLFIGKKYGAYLDYSPYSRFQIWLPYIGFRDIDADDIMGKTIELQYLVDLLSGACNAELKCGGTVLYSWQGQCGAQIPINSSDWSSMITGAISLAASAVKLGATIATGGAGVASIATDVASMGTAATGMKPGVTRGGTVAGAAGFMAAQKPYIVFSRPEAAIPANQNALEGYPSFVTMSLGALTGYNEIYSAHLEGIPATQPELDELYQILREGVIF